MSEQEKNMITFYHHTIQSWIRAYMGDFLDVLRRYRSWEWLDSRNWFIQAAWKHEPEDQNPMFYDLYLKGNSLINHRKYYHIFIEIKTWYYDKKWLNRLKEEYKHITDAGWKFKRDDNRSLLLWIVRESEVLKLVDDMTDPELINGLISGNISFFQLDYLEPYVYNRLTDLSFYLREKLRLNSDS